MGWVVSRSVEVGEEGLCVVPGADLVDHDDALDPFDDASRKPLQLRFNMTLYESMRATFVSRSRELVQR